MRTEGKFRQTDFDQFRASTSTRRSNLITFGRLRVCRAELYSSRFDGVSRIVRVVLRSCLKYNEIVIITTIVVTGF